MEEYDLTDSEEAGRLARLINKVTGERVHFVLAYAIQTDEEWAQGAITNVEPEQAAKILLAAADELMRREEKDYKVVTLRDN